MDSNHITVCCTEFHITYMADLSATTKIEIFMIMVCWTEFYIIIFNTIFCKERKFLQSIVFLKRRNILIIYLNLT